MSRLNVLVGISLLVFLAGQAHSQEARVVGPKTDAAEEIVQHVLNAAKIHKRDGTETTHCMVCDLGSDLNADHYEQLREHIKSEGHVVLKNADTESVSRICGIGMDAPLLAVRSARGGRHLHILVLNDWRGSVDSKLYELKAPKDAPKLEPLKELDQLGQAAASATPSTRLDSLVEFLSIPKSAALDASPPPGKSCSLCASQDPQPELIRNSEASITYSIYFPASTWGLDSPKRLTMWGRYDVNLFATASPERAKFVQVVARDLGFRSDLSFNSKKVKGWLTTAAIVNVAAQPELATKRIAYAPKGKNADNSITYSSGYSFGASGGGSGENPTTGLTYTINQSTAASTTYSDFEVLDQALPESNTWTWRYTDLYRNKPNLLVPGDVEFKPEVPAALSHNTLSPKCEVLYRVGESDNDSYSLTIVQVGYWTLARAFMQGIYSAVSVADPQTGTAGTKFTVDLGQVKVAKPASAPPRT